jgi:hypothetical protein
LTISREIKRLKTREIFSYAVKLGKAMPLAQLAHLEAGQCWKQAPGRKENRAADPHHLT